MRDDDSKGRSNLLLVTIYRSVLDTFRCPSTAPSPPPLVDMSFYCLLTGSTVACISNVPSAKRLARALDEPTHVATQSGISSWPINCRLISLIDRHATSLLLAKKPRPRLWPIFSPLIRDSPDDLLYLNFGQWVSDQPTCLNLSITCDVGD